MGAAILSGPRRALRQCSNQGTFAGSNPPASNAAGNVPFIRHHQTKPETMTTETATKDKLVADLKVLISDSEELLRASAGQAGEKIAAARERIQASLATAKVKLGEAERAALEQAKKAARATDEYVQDNPWQAVGIAAVAGLLLGVLISRR
jgi:ElaB/YqjD/DUF883 family membrane-anchored ribosome-binding protein